MEKKKNAVSFMTVVTITGAVISYRIGAGFASGNECIQIFGSWGEDVGWAVLGAVLVLLLGAVGVYLLSYELQFDGSDDGYRAVGGKGFGKFVQIFTGIMLLLNFLTMFAGAGSLLNQQYGLPNWVGSTLAGVVTFISLLGGLKSLEKVLGSIGIIILVYLLVFGVVTLFTTEPNFDNIYGAKAAVEAGEIMQVNLFSLPPFSWIPGLAEHNNAFINGVVYGAEANFCSFPFLIMLAKRCKSKKEAVVCGLAGDLGYMFCVCVSLVVLMFNFDSIMNPVTYEMNPFPTLAAVTKLIPILAWTYAILCFLGVFTTISGYLFAVDEMVFKENITSRNSKIFQIGMIVIGILLGGVLPFSNMINVLLPVRGVVGILLIVLVFAALARVKKKSAVKEVEAEGIECESTEDATEHI
ncbi:hypothetical protein OCV51_10100 [Faecalicatena acetigenes]|uniref:Branched-chain amino acid transport system carrier protein n=1 Tax=Faecalicatena acetigenes TaxID=2981790 RepID=A0ABT2TEA9_9FIRM|nr:MULTISPECIES: hypothetical protein [Lachnospiraceae]MCU6747999.1 hypothetical protein [Faecalicatena acetigenes]SCI21392.1 Uncharacterized membrane protein [uncultured Clostridium sp.]